MGSPCTDVCKLDQETGLCLGCFRSREEIKTFRSMDDAAKLDLFDELLKRRAAKEQTKSPRS
ncbi:Fe-S protein [Caballeronia zhejiangensis]|uniref:Fe-S protein n=1 Tax=Caballeronia zhejiangensis TaxID=871203 RepID=A0A656QI97_9BURK|nr:Fe-S protein [Caballeronia zhejiangensis]